MSKFKRGDKVRCIGPFVSLDTNGYGWEEGLVFTITSITGNNIYWEGNDNCGVFEEYLELAKVDNWKERIKNGG